MGCPSCGATVSPADGRCRACGAELTSGDERRTVTVLFADLVGFTALSEDRDPEQIKAVVDTVFRRLSEDVVAFGGTVDKIVGDELVAVFGAPISHEDDAERAVRAALRLHETIAQLGAEVGFPLELRVGVNTGEVVVGRVGGGATTVMGDVVNVAHRLETAAAPGETLVGPATHQATCAAIAYTPRGTLQVKGRRDPVDAWRAEGASAPPGARRRAARAPLVGRDRELAALDALIDLAVHQHRAHVIVLIGEAGVGKRRLAEALLQGFRVRHSPHAWSGRCLPYGEATPLWPLVEMVHQACGAELGTDPDALAAALAVELEGHAERDRIVAAVRYLLGRPSPLDALEPARGRQEAFRALVDLVAGFAARAPLMLVISGAQWADDALGELLADAVTRLRRLPVVLVLTGRPELLSRWRPELGSTVLELGPLDRDGATALVRHLLGTDPDPAVGEALIARSGGNPLFLEEQCAVLRASGLPPHDPAALDAVLELPDSLRGVVSARLDALPAEVRALIEDAAVVGRSGPVAALEVLAAERGAAAARPDTELLRISGGVFEFTADVVRDVAYDRLTKASRARRHARLAAWFATAEGDVSALAAHHYAAAARYATELGEVAGVPTDLRDRAVAAVAAAAERAAQRDLPPLAARLSREALALVGPDDPRRPELLIRAARALAALRELDEAAALVAQALDCASSPTLAAHAYTVLADVHQKAGRLDAALGAVDQAEACWRTAGATEHPGRAETLRIAGLIHLFAGALDDAEAAVRDAWALARRHGDQRLVAWALQHLAWIAFMRGDAEEADRRLAESAATFEALGDTTGLGWAHGLLAWVRYYQGRLDDAETLGQAVLSTAQQLGDRWAEAITLVLLAAVHLWRGRTTTAVTLATRAREQFVALGDAWGELQALLPLGRALVATGHVAEGSAAVRDAHALGGRVADPNARVLVATFAAQLAVQLGDGTAALQELEAVEAETRSTFVDASERLGLRGLARLLVDDVDGAVTDLETAAAAAATVSRWAYLGGSLALALVRAGRDREARAAARRARDVAVTYLDALFAAVADALAAAHLGATAEADRAAAEAVAAADATEDLAAQALARLAAAEVATVTGAPDAEQLAEDAQRRFAALGAGPGAWLALLRRCGRGRPTT